MSQKKINILFRTSGGRAHDKELGLGHIYRCINLALHFSKNEIYFIIEDYGGAKKILGENGFKRIFFLRNEIDVASDIKETSKIVKERKIDILIVDKYGINHKYLKEISKFVKTILITDLKNVDYKVDLVVNGFVGFKSGIRKNKYNTKCLMGPAYQILNKNFSKNIKAIKKYTILATFGGLDDHNVIETFLTSISKYIKKIKVKIILGPATMRSEKIKIMEKRYRNHIKIIQRTKNMFKEISEAEFGICSGGITTYEFASLNVPFAIICQVNHQLITAREWERKGIALNLGLINYKTPDKIEKIINKILEKKICLLTNNNHIIDGKGAQRVVREILKIKPNRSLKT